MLQNHLSVGSIGDDKKILSRHYRKKPFKSAAYKTFPRAKHVKELLRAVVLAQRPKTAPYAAGHYYYMCLHGTDK
jgi:hypothetical protein